MELLLHTLFFYFITLLFLGKLAYEMQECGPDWEPSLHLGHTEVKATPHDRFNRSTRRLQAVTGGHAAPAPLDAAGQGLKDEAATADNASQMDDAESNYNTAEQQEYHAVAGMLKLTACWRRTGDWRKSSLKRRWMRIF